MKVAPSKAGTPTFKSKHLHGCAVSQASKRSMNQSGYITVPSTGPQQRDARMKVAT